MSTPVTITPAGEILANDIYLGTIAPVTINGQGAGFEATGYDGTTVVRYSPTGAAYALRDAMLGEGRS
jgi:hypothetical protein